jgi:hypothetical protein
LGQHLFDEVLREDTGSMPRGQDQGSQGQGVFKGVAPSLYSRIVIAYAVFEA